MRIIDCVCSFVRHSSSTPANDNLDVYRRQYGLIKWAGPRNWKLRRKTIKLITSYAAHKDDVTMYRVYTNSASANKMLYQPFTKLLPVFILNRFCSLTSTTDIGKQF